jgi:hypothetical protein
MKALHPVCVAWLCGIAPAGAQEGEKITLKLALKPGTSYAVRTTMDQTIREQVGAARTETRQTIRNDLRTEIEEVDRDGVARVAIKYVGVSVKIAGPGGSVEFDSQHPPRQVHPVARSYAALLGKGYQVRLAPDGRVNAVIGGAQLAEALLKDLNLRPGPERDQAAAALRRDFGDETIRESVERSMAIFPNKPVGVGDEWTSTMKLSRRFPMVLQNRFRVRERKEGRAVLDVTTAITPNPEARHMEMGPIRYDAALEGNQAGTLEVDEATGWIVRSQLKQAIKGTLKPVGRTDVPPTLLDITGTLSHEPGPEIPGQQKQTP